MSLVRNFIEDWSRYRRSIDEGGFHEYEHMWGMVIDLDKCTGCNACSVACYAENNLAVVGEDKFENGQGMHWMRIERYWDEPNLGNERVRDTQEHARFRPPTTPQMALTPRFITAVSVRVTAPTTARIVCAISISSLTTKTAGRRRWICS